MADDSNLINSANELLTNRRRALTAESSLEEVANEDVISPQQNVLVIQAAKSTPAELASSNQTD
ncbi:MAG: hypothetical protein M0Q43_08480, partial [Methanothrix sp.]|nr:hypothetical protein [Methanothrix sp.]